MTKKKEPLKPEIIENNPDLNLPMVNIENLDKQVEINTILDIDNTDEDSFFKAVVSQLYNNENVETKTENSGVRESFFLTRMSLIAKTYDVPIMGDFINILERKRISIDRKGRKELIVSLLERQQEIERQRASQQANALGGV